MPLTPAERLEILHELDRDTRRRRETVSWTRADLDVALTAIEEWYDRGGVQAAINSRLPGRVRAQAVTLMRAVSRRSGG